MRNDAYYWLTPLAIIAACIAGYYITLSSGFLADDFVIMYNINKGLIVETGAGGAFFRPLVWATFSLNWFMFNHEPVGFHLFNLALHIVAALGVAACASLLFRSRVAGLLAGLVFALHPAHPEAVVWIAGRYDVMTGALLAWSLFFHLHMRVADVMRHPLIQLISLTLFILACLSKEAAFVFPLVIILINLIPSGSKIGKAVLRAVPYLIVAVILFILRWIMVGGIGGGEYIPPETSGVVSAGVLYQAFVQPFYMLIFPMNRPLFEPFSVLGIMTVRLVLVLPFVFLFIGSSWRMALMCALSIIVCALPTAYVGLDESTLRNTRFLYIPSIFFAILIAGLLARNKWSVNMKKVAGVIAAAYLLVIFLCLQQNNIPWHDAGRIVRDAAISTDEIIKRHKSEWGITRNELLVVDIPRTNLGALAFDWGFPEMLILRHGDAFENVEVEIIYSGVHSPENVLKMENARAEGIDVWFFNEEDRVFEEGFSE